MLTWTSSLRSAALAVADEPQPHPYGHDYTDTDVRSRAREFARCPSGTRLSAAQYEYLICFLQRLDLGASSRPAHVAFRAAFNNASAVTGVNR
jgi:hypothetical protein